MRLLIVTQKVDKQDPILGFFHAWIGEFAKQCESVIVIGQMVGAHDLPANVTVLSLGKERGVWRIFQIPKYRWMLFKHRREYDAILVHMTPIWVVFAWIESVVFRKRLYLWYEARGVRWPLKVALLMVRKVFSASKSGMPIATAKSVVTGHGIDIDTFTLSDERRDVFMLLTVGRITESKRLSLLVRTLTELSAPYRLLVGGKTITKADEQFYARLLEQIQESGLNERVEFTEIARDDLPMVLQCAAVFLHASQTSLDKALLEAMACGCLVVSCAEAAQAVLPKECLTTPTGMSERVKTLLSLPEAEQEALRRQLRQTVVQDHSLPRLVGKLVKEMGA